jgi:hypothetical protein
MSKTVSIDVRVTEEHRQAAWRLRQFADRVENWRTSSSPPETAGVDLKPFRLAIGDSCKVLYTVDCMDGIPVRHLSISVWYGENDQNLVDIPANFAQVILQLFGFTPAATVGIIPHVDDKIVHGIERLTQQGEA